MDVYRRLLLASVLCLPQFSTTYADDYAIETEVYEQGLREPVSANLTIFVGSEIYDFLQIGPERVTRYDTATRQFTLTDIRQRVRTTIPADQLVRFVATERGRAIESTNPIVRFAVAPTFQQSFNSENGRLSLRSRFWDYQVDTLTPLNSDCLQQYLEFADAYTHLNAVLGAMPPGARLELNRVLTEKGRLPSRIEARIKREDQEVSQRYSQHKYIWSVSSRERERIQRWRDELPELRQVTFEKYRQLP